MQRMGTCMLHAWHLEARVHGPTHACRQVSRHARVRPALPLTRVRERAVDVIDAQEALPLGVKILVAGLHILQEALELGGGWLGELCL